MRQGCKDLSCLRSALTSRESLPGTVQTVSHFSYGVVDLFVALLNQILDAS